MNNNIESAVNALHTDHLKWSFFWSRPAKRDLKAKRIHEKFQETSIVSSRYKSHSTPQLALAAKIDDFVAPNLLGTG